MKSAPVPMPSKILKTTLLTTFNIISVGFVTIRSFVPIPMILMPLLPIPIVDFAKTKS